MLRSCALSIVLMVGMVSCATVPSQPQGFELGLPGGLSVPVKAWHTESGPRVLWLSSDRGFPAGMQDLASQLQREGIEVWQADLLGADFLPQVPSSLGKISDDSLVQLLRAALDADGRALVLMADGQGARLLVRLAGRWRQQHDGQWPRRVKSVVLVSPILYTATPEVGADARYLDQADALGGRVWVYQPNRSPYFWWLERTERALSGGPSAVTIKVMQNVRDRFYFRPDASATELVAAARFGKQIADGLRE